jgi:membrane-bound hydrogenase subunit alpha
MIEQCLEHMPSGAIVSEPKITKLLAKLKTVNGEGIGRMEAPRGEVFHYVKMNANEHIYSWKVRAPTYNNIMPWVPMLKGQQIADIPIVAASTDPCMSCTNRVTVIKNKNSFTLDKEELHQLSIQKTRRLNI